MNFISLNGEESLVDDLMVLKELFSRATLNTMSGAKKKAFQYTLTAIFINLISGRQATQGQVGNIQLAYEIKESRLKKEQYVLWGNSIWKTVQDSLHKSNFKKPYDNELVNRIIAFTRERLSDIEKEEVSLFQTKQIKDILDYKKFTGQPAFNDNHWFELNIYKGVYPTIPEMIIFNDLKVHWNLYLELLAEQDEKNKQLSHQERFEMITDVKSRELRNKIGGMQRNLVFLAVTFVEACLYDFFYNIKLGNHEETEAVKGVLKEKKINDKQIVEKVIYKLYPEEVEKIKPHYANYKKILNYRDRYVHASPFMDESKHISQLQPLLQVTKSKTIEFLQYCYDFIRQIDDCLPDKYKMLFWMFDDEVNFHNEESLPLTNDQSRLSKISYYG